MSTSARGFASMDDKKQHDIASRGGSASSGNNKKDSQNASGADMKAAANQPIETKARGGASSTRNR
jgi:general stress protein YciG